MIMMSGYGLLGKTVFYLEKVEPDEKPATMKKFLLRLCRYVLRFPQLLSVLFQELRAHQS